MPQPRVTVILPVYNVERFLAACLRSVLGQSHVNIEVFAVNDGSTDGSLKILQDFARADTRLKILDRKNGGLSDARNAALPLASGRYLLFVDSDDILRPDAVEKLVAKAEGTDADIVMTLHGKFREEPSEMEIWPHLHAALKELSETPRHPEEIDGIFFDLEFYAWSALFRKEFLDRFKKEFPTGLLYEDIVWHGFHRLRANRLAAINEPLYFHRVHPGSITGRLRCPHHLIPILQQFEADNAGILKNRPLLKWKFTRYKVFALLEYHLRPILRDSNFISLYWHLRDIKRLLSDISHYTYGKLASQLDFIQNTPVVFLYLYYLPEKLSLFVWPIIDFIIDFRCHPRKKEAFLRILGVKIDLSHLFGLKIAKRIHK